MKMVSRRGWLLAAVGLTIVATVQAEERRYVVLSLIGDRFEVVFPHDVTGSNVDRNRRYRLEDPQASFDRVASLAVEQELKRASPDARITLLAMPPSVLHDEPEKLFDGAQVALPGSVIAALDQARATHLVLLTKHRGNARVPVVNGYVGIGKVRGVGFYVDAATHLVAVDSGNRGVGFLAPFVSIRATLADASTGQVLRDERIEGAENYSNAERAADSQPWDLLTAEQKIVVLRSLVEREIGRVMPVLLSAR